MEKGEKAVQEAVGEERGRGLVPRGVWPAGWHRDVAGRLQPADVNHRELAVKALLRDCKARRHQREEMQVDKTGFAPSIWCSNPSPRVRRTSAHDWPKAVRGVAGGGGGGGGGGGTLQQYRTKSACVQRSSA